MVSKDFGEGIYYYFQAYHREQTVIETEGRLEAQKTF